MLAQAFLGVLLREPNVKKSAHSVSLARSVAGHWMSHAHIENVASLVRDGMKHLLDLDKS